MAKDKKDIFYLETKGIYKSTNLVVMCFDVIGFSKSTTNEDMKDCIRDIDAAIMDELWENYNWNESGNIKNDFILTPTGDGYIFAFHVSYKGDVALDIIKKFYCRLTNKLKFKIRMGAAKGPCQVYQDQNEKNNVFGYSINLANRVMGLASANQILVHEEMAKEILHQRRHNELHEVKKSFEVKHSERIRVYNFYGNYEGMEFGNSADPEDPIAVVKGGN